MVLINLLATSWIIDPGNTSLIDMDFTANGTDLTGTLWVDGESVGTFNASQFNTEYGSSDDASASLEALIIGYWSSGDESIEFWTDGYLYITDYNGDYVSYPYEVIATNDNMATVDYYRQRWNHQLGNSCL